MRISQKRTCNNCKAEVQGLCDLGYDSDIYKVYHGITVSYRPLEPCPKPITNPDWCIAMRNYKKLIITND